jgi:hypothetical protein
MEDITMLIVSLWCFAAGSYLIGWFIYSYKIRHSSIIPSLFLEQTSKICPICGSDKLLLFSSLNQKACTDCNKEIPWTLASGQKGSYE